MCDRQTAKSKWRRDALISEPAPKRSLRLQTLEVEDFYRIGGSGFTRPRRPRHARLILPRVSDQNPAGRYPLISSPTQISKRVGILQAIGFSPWSVLQTYLTVDRLRSRATPRCSVGGAKRGPPQEKHHDPAKLRPLVGFAISCGGSWRARHHLLFWVVQSVGVGPTGLGPRW